MKSSNAWNRTLAAGLLVLLGCVSGCLIPTSHGPPRDSLLPENLVYSPYSRETGPRCLGAYVDDELFTLNDTSLPSIITADQTVQRIRRELELLPASDPDLSIQINLFSGRRRLNQYIDQQMPGIPHRRAFAICDRAWYGLVYRIFSFQCNESLEADLRHEVTHAALYGQNVPIWLDEGLAEYYEPGLDHDEMVAVNTEQLQQLLNTPDWQPNLRRLESLPTDHRMSALDYAESWLWVHLLMTDPGSRGMTQRYLADRRANQSRVTPTAPIYVRLQQITSNPDTAARAHLDRLADQIR